MTQLVLAFMLSSPVLFAAQPFLIFAADAAYIDPHVVPVVTRYLSQSDYLGLSAVTRVPTLGNVVGRDHLVQMSPSLNALATDVMLSELSGADRNTIFYYQEMSERSPAEQPALLQTIGRAAQLVHQRSGRRFGILPGASFFGFSSPCHFDTNATAWRSLDWKQIDYVSVQGAILLADECLGNTSLDQYGKLLSTVSEYVRQENPGIVITAQLSFRNTAPGTMLSAAKRLNTVVDGFFFSYPLNPLHEHVYCTPQSLGVVLSALRPAR